MTPGDETVASLREALKFSPNNLPLRQHLVDTLLGLGRAEEAERECRAALGLSPNDEKLKSSLARAFYKQGKNSEALVLVEAMAKSPACLPKVLVLYARLLLQAGDESRAASLYRRAIDADPEAADLELANQLGGGAGSGSSSRGGSSSDTADGRVRAAWDESAGEPVEGEIERPRITFNDVGGMDGVKDEIRMKIIHPLSHPELYKAYGKKIGGGIMMYGPPGCGKTHLARATAGEIKSSFLAVGISDVLDMWIGNSEKNLHQLFEQARRNKPCVLFFDEVDALAASRADLRHSGARHLINQFLAEMDGIQADNEGLLILAATNAPWHVDGAFRRPGRFDRILFVPPPDGPARQAIVRILTTGKPVADIDYDTIAKKTDAFSGADLKGVVERAIETKLKDAMKQGVPTPMTTKDFLRAAAELKPSTREWFATARNYALYSNQGGIYDEILKYLKM